MVQMSKVEIIKMRIKRIEKEIRDTPYHKGTEHHIGLLRAKLAKLKDSEIEAGKKSGGGMGYAIKKQGDATVVLVGPPSAGKSTLVNKLTNANSRVAPYAFTTVTVVPGMMKYKDAMIQILDVPGLIEGAHEGKGRGREVLSVVRGCDLLIIISDIKRKQEIDEIKKTLQGNGIRINIPRPKVRIEKRLKGGVIIHSNFKQEVPLEVIKQLARELGIKNAEITINEKLSMERLIDGLSKNRVFIPALSVLNKIDEQQINEDMSEFVLISAEQDINLDKLRELIWEKLDFLRVYLIRESEEPNQDNPIVVRNGIDLKAVAELIGSDFSEIKKRARIWGKGAKFPGQEVSLTKKVEEGMIIRFV